MVISKPLAASALILSIMCFAGNYLVGGIAASSMPLMSLMYIKWGASAIPLLIFAHYFERPAWRSVLKSWPKILLLGSLGIAAYSFGLYQALRTTSSPINAALINAFNPAMIAVASAIFLREKLSVIKVLGVLIGFLGVVWVLTGGQPALILQQRLAIGDLWMLAVVASWTCYMVLYRVGPSLPPVTNAALQMLFFTLAMTPFMLYEGISVPTSSAGTWSLVYIAIFPSAVAYSLWAIGSKTIEPGQAGQFLNLMVPFTAIGSLMMGKTVSAPEIVGGALILIGVYLASKQASSLAPEETTLVAKTN